MKRLYNDGGVKPKSVIINGGLHNDLKIFCKGKSMKIGGVVEDLINLYLKDYRSIQTLIDKQKELQ